MTVIHRHRRQFLVGAGGFMLALPFMPSLLSRTARAQYVAPKRFVAFNTTHGGVWGANMCPPDAMLGDAPTQLYSDHRIRSGTLALTVDGERASLSPVLTASTSLLTRSLASKLNVLRGFDVTLNIGHHTGGHLGNYARTDTEEVRAQVAEMPTIDQVMAYSPSFYPRLDGIRLRSMHVGRVCSYDWSNPSNRSGRIQPIARYERSAELFNEIFDPGHEPASSARVPVVDRVFESYQRLRGGAFGAASRLSSRDRQRLTEHLDRIQELQRRLGVVASCDGVSPPSRHVDEHSPGHFSGIYKAGDPVAAGDYYKTFNDVIAAAFICGTSRIAVVYPEETFSTFTGDWHQDVAHMATERDAMQRVLTDSHQEFFERVFLDLAAKLDVEEADGQTYLDNTLISWTQESGPTTHAQVSMPVITAGSAGGFLRTGRYIDYRNRERTDVLARWDRIWSTEMFPGLLYNQYLATVLQAMGVPPSEFERDGTRGYGSVYIEPNLSWANGASGGDGRIPWPDRLRNDASNVLPLLRA